MIFKTGIQHVMYKKRREMPQIYFSIKSLDTNINK